jgi:hypothetical protein
MYQIGVEAQSYEFDSVREYVEWVSYDNSHIKAWVTSENLDETKSALWDDEDMKFQLIEAVEDADGKVQGGHGVIVAFWDGESIMLESVEAM